MLRQRVRIRFRKQGDLRWISHRDLVRVFERLMRRAGLRLGMSEGFHPKARMTFPSALALGVEGLQEIMEFELAEPLDAEQIAGRLAAQAPPGLTLTEVRLLQPHERKARLQRATYRMPVPPAWHEPLEESIRQLEEQPSFWIQREADPEKHPPASGLDQLDFQHGTLQFRLWCNQQGGVSPRDVLQALRLDDLQRQGACLTRSEVEIEG
jgi:radical SAM-linked protein